jgi:hypothetical protein
MRNGGARLFRPAPSDLVGCPAIAVICAQTIPRNMASQQSPIRKSMHGSSPQRGRCRLGIIGAAIRGLGRFACESSLVSTYLRIKSAMDSSASDLIRSAPEPNHRRRRVAVFIVD